MKDILDIFDIILTPLYFIVIIFISNIHQRNMMLRNSEYKYFSMGLFCKILGSIALGLVYNFYYPAGDTTNYFQSARAYLGLIGVNNDDFFMSWLGSPDSRSYTFFTQDLEIPEYSTRDSNTFFIVRLEIPIVLLGLKTYFPSAILTATICYSGMWKLFKVFCSIFPDLTKQFAISILFIPSVLFWGSGIMKDSFALSAVGWYTYAFYSFFIKKKYSLIYILYLLISSYLLISIKPYIFFAIMPGTIVWLSQQQLERIKNKILKFLFGPIAIGISVVISFYFLSAMGSRMGKYKIETVIERAVITQKDMKSSHYNGNSFDIGEFDASISGVISKGPIAIFSGLFRPSIIEIRNPMMLLSAIENTFFLIFTILLLFRLRLKGFFIAIGSNPIVLFSVLFSLFFAFSVGLSISNFGSLVRLRIPAIPFFISSLYILRNIHSLKLKNKNKSNLATV